MVSGTKGDEASSCTSSSEFGHELCSVYMGVKEESTVTLIHSPQGMGHYLTILPKRLPVASPITMAPREDIQERLRGFARILSCESMASLTAVPAEELFRKQVALLDLPPKDRDAAYAALRITQEKVIDLSKDDEHPPSGGGGSSQSSADAESPIIGSDQSRLGAPSPSSQAGQPGGSPGGGGGGSSATSSPFILPSSGGGSGSSTPVPIPEDGSRIVDDDEDGNDPLMTSTGAVVTDANGTPLRPSQVPPSSPVFQEMDVPSQSRAIRASDRLRGRNQRQQGGAGNLQIDA